jgi:uncharacterized membrane protein YdbT with pleckstrin-like domain
MASYEHLLFQGHPSWRSMLGFYVRGLFLALVTGTVAGLVSRAAEHRVQVLWVLAAVLIVFVIGLTRGTLRQIATTYTVTDQRLTIERGLFSREVRETSLDRVQNVRCRQSLMQRLLRVGSVEFDTAGGAEFDFSLGGVEHPRRIARAVDGALHARPLPPSRAVPL